MVSLKATAHHLIGIGLAVVAGVLQAVIASSPTNDDFLHVVLARQILAGDWPVRDFFDLGTWLTYGMSAVGQLIFGHRLLARRPQRSCPQQGAAHHGLCLGGLAPRSR